MSAETSGSLSDVAGVYIDADYSTCTLTAVLTDEDGNDIDVDDTTSVSYTWYKSSDGSDGSYSEISGSTDSTYSSFLDGYYYYVEVTLNDTTATPSAAQATYKSAVKHITTEVDSVKIQNDIYRDGVLTALLLNSEGDVLYYDDSGNSSTATPTNASASDMTTYNSGATYTWYHYYYSSNNTYIYSEKTYTYNNAPAPDNKDNYAKVDDETDNKEVTDKNTLEPLFTYTSGSSTTKGVSYYYYVVVTIGEDEYISDWRIGTVYAGISVEIEQVKNSDGTITLNMIIYDDNGDIMIDEDDGSYYYNSDDYTTTWYKSKEYFASTGDGTTADEDSEVETSSSAPLGYRPQDYYGESNYMRVSNAAASVSNTVGYTNTITVEGEVGRYYYVDINAQKTNGSAEAGSDPVFVRNCTSTVVIEDNIAEDGTFKAVVYDESGNQVNDTSSYTFTWYKTTSGTTKYKGLADATGTSTTFETSEAGRFVSSYYGATYGAYYSDSGCFSYSRTYNNKTSEFGGTLMDSTNISISYALVRGSLSDDISDVTYVFENANYSFDTTEGSTETFALNVGASGTSLNDGDKCNVADDEGQLRYYYVTAAIDGITYTSAVKYVKYSSKIENGGFQDSGNSTTYDSSLTTYWQTTNMGYSDNASNYGYPETYYRLRPLLELATYTSSNAYGTYGNYYSFPGLSYDKENIETQETTDYYNGTIETDNYLSLNYDDDSTTEYLFPTNQFCEINSTDTNTLYQTVMTVPGMPLYWSLTHRARTSTASSSNGGLKTLLTSDTLYQDSNDDVTLNSLGVTSAKAYVAVDIMYVVIMKETDAESLLANGADLDAQQKILDNMIASITGSASADVIQSSEDGSSYLASYGSNSYTYNGKTYDDVSIWRVQTGSTKVELTFGPYTTGSEEATNAETAAKAAAVNQNLLKYYAKEYGIVKSYYYSSSNSSTGETTYYTTFYTESESYADTYDIPNGQYVSRYFFVAGNSTNTTTGYGTNDKLSFGSYENDSGETKEVTDYNGITRATNTGAAGNFVDNVVFSQQLDVKVNYWVYEYDSSNGEWKYVLKKTEAKNVIEGREVTADSADDYSDKYFFVGSYVSANGGDADTPDETDGDGKSVLGSDTSFTAKDGTALVMDLYYKEYEVSIEKEIVGLPENMDYSDFKDKLQITIYALESNGSGGYTKGDTAIVDGESLTYDKVSDDEESLTYSTLSENIRLEKGTYLIYETTDMLLLESFDGWYSVEMSLNDGTVLTYDDTLEGFILTVGEDSDEADGEEDAVINISLVNTYKPIAVEATKSVLLGETSVSSINTGLGSTNPDSDTSLTYQSLTEYDNALRSVDDTDIDNDEERLAVLSGDTLTYRMELTSGGRADSKEIEVTDTIPSGCTLVDGSIMILKQTRAENTNSYGVVSTVLTSSGNGTTNNDVTTWTTTDSNSVTFTIEYDSGADEITWKISSMSSNEQYYVEYAVTVDQIKSSTERELLTNTAEWSYLSEVNSGASSDTGTSVEVTMAMTKTEDISTTYTVTFSDLSNYTITALKDALPDGFVIDTTSIEINDTSLSNFTNYTVEYYDSDGDKLVGTLGTDYYESDIASFIISYSDGITQSSVAITLKFSGTQETTGTAGEEIRNMAGITYTKSGENTPSYTSIVACGEGVTNQVETDVTHLYIELEKKIAESDTDLTVDTSSTDTEQTFLFIVEYYAEGKTPGTDTADSISYVTINCENGIGNRLLQADRRGTYVITEVTDWSITDYDYVSASLDGTSVSGESVSVDYTSSGTYLEESGSGAFVTTLGLVNGTHATATFYNTESLYAYRSGSAYAKNKMGDAQ